MNHQMRRQQGLHYTLCRRMYPHSRWGAAQCAAALACFLAVAVAQQGSQPTTRVAVIVARGPSYKNQLVYVPNM